MSKHSLNVLQILPNLGVGGVERGTVQMTEALVERGHKAFVVSGDGPLVKEIEQAGGKHLLLKVGQKSPITFFFIPKLIGLFLKYNIDIVHSRSRLPAWLTMAALKLMPKEKRPIWFTTIHGPYSVNLYSGIMNKGDQVIAVSKFIKDYVFDHYTLPKNKKITVIHRGVEEKEYKKTFVPTEAWVQRWKDITNYPNKAKILTLAGRITRWKGQLEFIKLLHQVRSQGIDAHGLIIGGIENKYSNYYKELLHLIKILKVKDKITFLGARNDLKEIFSISDCAYSLTSKPEAFGRTTVEALSLGTPVIGYDHGGTSEILKTMFPRGLVPPHDIKKAVTLTTDLLANGSDPVYIKANPYTVSQMQEKTIALYEKASSSHK